MALVGMDKVLANLQRVQRQLEKAAESAVYLSAADIMRESLEITPKDTGTLRGSGYVSSPDRDMRGISCEMGYGGHAREYAVHQHEVPEGTYGYTTPGTGPKYLERPFDEGAKNFLQNSTAILRAALRTGAAPSATSEFVKRPYDGPDLRRKK